MALQINAFYLQKERELKARLATLLNKRKAALQRLQDAGEDGPIGEGVEWRAVQEGFRLLERDLSKLQVRRHFLISLKYGITVPLALHRHQRHRIPEDTEEMG